MLDTAAFAQLTLETTDDPDHPVRPRSTGSDDYKLGVSRASRAAKRMFSSHLLTQFTAAEPFRTGPRSRLMNLGARTMADMRSK